MKRRDTRQRKQALAGLKTTAGTEWMLSTLVRVIHSGKQALDAVMLEMGRMVAESVMLMEREEVAGPDYYPTDPALQKWAHEQGSIYLGDQKVPVTRPRLRHVDQGEVTLQSYARLRSAGVFSEELLEKVLRGVSVQKYADTVLNAAQAGGPDGGETPGVPRTVPGGVYPVRALSGYDPPRGRGVCRGPGRGRVGGEDGAWVLAGLVGES